ncbi:MAG TPA: site-specific integrase, partial [Terriglobales bacterium]|nr:site-specific integrase [Terriglobales bacterium]
EKAGTKANAQKLYHKRKGAALEGRKFPERLRAPAPMFNELADAAIAYSKAHNRSHSDDESRIAVLKKWFGQRTAESVTPEEIERHLSKAAEERSWSPATVNRYRNTLSLIYRLGVNNGKVDKNPARLVRARRENNIRIRYLDQFSLNEEKRLRKAIPAEHLPEFEIALQTGMRLSEQYGLRRDAVDLRNSVLTVPPSKYGEARSVPLNTAARAAFERLNARSADSEWAMVNEKGERMLIPRRWFETAVKAAKLPNFTWHCLRHTFASRLVMIGVDLRTVQELMGHKDIRMTCRYAHLAPGHKLGAVEKLAAWDSANPTGTRTDTGRKAAGRSGAAKANLKAAGSAS